MKYYFYKEYNKRKLKEYISYYRVYLLTTSVLEWLTLHKNKTKNYYIYLCV